MPSVFTPTAVLLTAQLLAIIVQPDPGWKGRKVMPLEDTVVRSGPIEDEKAVQQGRLGIAPWVVQAVKDDWLLVGEREKGWVKISDVVPLEDAVVYYTKIIKAGNPSVYGNRELRYSLTGFPDLAIADYGEMLRLMPSAGIYTARGHVWGTKKEFDKALSDFKSAIQLDPNHSMAYNNTAWIRATCPVDKYLDGKEAVELATKACEMSGWTSAYYCGTLGAAYAESGDFDLAVKFQTKAIELNRHDADFLKRAKQRIGLYKDHKPYRDQ